MPERNKGQRKQQILQTLARMLENPDGRRVTTALLAREVGVSEAALYRHFASKAQMYEALLSFSEETLFSRIGAISNNDMSVDVKCHNIITVVLTFAERNPGICRLLAGDALAGESPRLSQRIHQLFERLETQLKQLIREAEYQEKITTTISANNAANLLISIAEGKIRHFIRSQYTRKPLGQWEDQWPAIREILFIPAPHQGALTQ